MTTHQQGADIQGKLDEVRSQVSVIKVAYFNSCQHSFTHIFGGGYASGYCSYKLAEVLSADALSGFKQVGIFNAETGRSFLENVLQFGVTDGAV